MKKHTGHAGLFVLAIATLALYMTTHAGHAREGIAFLAFGYAVGAYGTMVGAGGGFLIVPALLLIYHAPSAQAAGTALTVVFLNALSGTISYAKQKRIDYRAGKTFAIACLPGAIAGAFMSKMFTGHTFYIIFGVVLLCVSALLIWRPAKDAPPGHTPDPAPRRWHWLGNLTDAEGHVFVYSYNWLVGATLSFFVGFMSSLLGIGGGIIHVPVLVYLLGFPPHLATATSHFILAITAGAGAATHLYLGHVMLWPAALMGVGVIGGAQIGALLGKRIHGTWLLRLLAIALVFVAVRLFLK
jgi:uncharacterized membrane protein YfcA